MREILFRGKDFNHSWYFGSLDTTEKDRAEIIYPDRFGNKCRIFVNPETVGQYTGMKDNNGKPIFEGDILRLGIGKTRFVFYGVSSFRHTIYNGYAKEFDFKDKGYQVIGNIHDNPELLKEAL